MKHIVICSDGTGNTAVKRRGTNVFKLYEAVDFEGHRTDPDHRVRQIGFYDDGVGTSRLKLLAALGGALGIGLGRNVRQLYADLARVYDPGDRIFLFGFSRGAFTARTLSGLIATCGIIDRHHPGCTSDDELRSRVTQAYRAYRDRYRTRLMQVFRGKASDKPESAVKIRTQWAVQHQGHRAGFEPWQVPIAFIGVWDTVDAVGFPVPWIADLWNETFYRFKFPDHVLGPMVERARHALAIDDERHTFHPLIWDEAPKANGAASAASVQDPDRIKQVWFSGVHSNVGGGYPKQGMSVVSLTWMMDEAEQPRTLADGTTVAGLRFSPGDRQLYHERQNVYDKLYDSRAGASFFYRYLPRDIDRFCREHRLPPRVHVSVLERCLDAPEGYAPGNVPRGAEIVGQAVPIVASTLDHMRTELGKRSSVLDSVRGLIVLRRVAYVVLIGVALLVIIMALANARWHLSEVSVTGLLTAVGRFVFHAVKGSRWWIIGLLLAMLAAYVANWLLTRKMKHIYSTFWFRVRPH